mgnify:CR=1 FL=1
MKTIKFNGRNLAVSASEERALFMLSRNNFTVMTSDFYERRGRYGESILPVNKDRREQLGISYYHLWYQQQKSDIDLLRVGIRAEHDVYGMTWRNATARERKFFTEHPRCQSVITGNPRRINAILKALDASDMSGLSEGERTRFEAEGRN